MRKILASLALLAFATVAPATDYRWEPAAGGRTWLWYGNTLAGCQYEDGTYMAFVAGSEPFEADPPIPCCGNQPVQAKDPPKTQPPPKRFKTGAKKTPLPKILEAISTGRVTVHRAVTTTPAQVAMVPKQLSIWGNDQYGDCVSAESAWAMAAYSTYLKLPEIFIPETTLIAWAKSHGFLDGADLLQVIQAMQTDGITDSTSTLRKEGTPSTVDYSTEAVLQNAISVGPVSIAIDSSALPTTAGLQNGWSAFGGSPGSFQNTDHCVGLGGYGPTKYLCDALGIAVPAGAPANAYLLFTWDSIGLVDFAWLQSTTAEAWLRTPTVLGLTPPPPPPPPPPSPPPPPPPPVTTTLYSMSTTPAGVITFTPTPAPATVVPASVIITVTHNADGSFTVAPAAAAQAKGK